MKNLILIGMPGCGKSTVGVLCAKALGMPFLDTDLVLQSRSGRLLQSLVNELGTEGFLRLEDGRPRVRLGGQVADYDVSDAACGLYDPLRRLICAVYENYAYLLG